MQDTLYLFRLRDDGGYMITTDAQGTRLPLDDDLDYKPGDWKYLGSFPSSELPKMLTNLNDAQETFAPGGWGYLGVSPSHVIKDHLFWRRHAPDLSGAD